MSNSRVAAWAGVVAGAIAGLWDGQGLGQYHNNKICNLIRVAPISEIGEV